MTDALPLVSIVTPSYNCGRYLEATLASVGGQSYPRIEHVVVDGGSTDNTLDVLRRFSGRVRWTSGRDVGMYDAINKGFAMAQGDILTYINADDLYHSNGAVAEVVSAFREDERVDFVYGHTAIIDERGDILYVYRAPRFHRALALAFPRILFLQPSCFWRRRVHKPFDTTFKYSADADFFRWLCERQQGRRVARTLARFRAHEDSQSWRFPGRLAGEGARIFGEVAEWATPLRFKLIDWFYIRLFLNWQANSIRLLRRWRGQPYA